MEKSNIMIRLEKKEEQQKVEKLVRESFWDVYRPGCMEHYVLHQLRNDRHLFQNGILKDKDTDSIINGYKKYMKDNEISDKDIETATSYVKPFVQFLLEKQEHIIDYPKDEKGKSKRNMTEEEKKAVQKKSEETKARNAKKQVESQDD